MSSAVESFGKYLLLERLASGGMAEVYLAKSFGAGGIGKFVAVKRILPQYSDNPEFIDMFKEEAKIVMNLNHSNVVTIFDFGVEKNQFFLVMEFVEGQNLRQVLTFMKKNAKYFTIDQIVYVIREAAAGLDHAHRCINASTGKQLNITHRDMSPQNIMLTFEGEIKIVDFGIAKAETQIENTRSGTIKGKFGYMSPEQAEGQVVDSRTDVFSLGIVLWELLAQDRLFTAQNEAATLRKIKEAVIPPIRKLNPAVHPDLEKIVTRCLMRDKSQRYQSAETLTKDLSRFLNSHYPDFSKQEFSKFFKSLYQNMFIENRKKLATYAKFDHQTANDKTMITDTSLETPQNSSPSQSDFVGAKDDQIQVDPNNSLKIDLEKLKNSGYNNSNRPIVRRVNTGVSRAHSSYNPQSSIRSTNLPPSPKSSSGNWASFIAVGSVLVLSGWWFVHNHRFDSGLDQGEKSFPTTEPPRQQPAETSVRIETSPSGADVYIDNRLVGSTPYLGHVKVDQPFHLRLFKEGYVATDLVAETASREGYRRTISLMSEAPMAQITVEANQTAGPDPMVYVDDTLMSRTIPAQIWVPSGRTVVIKVINTHTHMEGSETVFVSQGDKKPIRVNLSRSAVNTR